MPNIFEVVLLFQWKYRFVKIKENCQIFVKIKIFCWVWQNSSEEELELQYTQNSYISFSESKTENIRLEFELFLNFYQLICIFEN